MTQRERDIIEAANKFRALRLSIGPIPVETYRAEQELVTAALAPDDGPSLAERKVEVSTKWPVL